MSKHGLGRALAHGLTAAALAASLPASSVIAAGVDIS
jgi:hypothetical protein